MRLYDMVGWEVRRDDGECVGRALNLCFEKGGERACLYAGRERWYSAPLDIIMKADIVTDSLLARFRENRYFPVEAIASIDRVSRRVVLGKGAEETKPATDGLCFFFPSVVEEVKLPIYRFLKRSVYLTPSLGCDYLYGRSVWLRGEPIGTISDFNLLRRELVLATPSGGETALTYPLGQLTPAHDLASGLGLRVVSSAEDVVQAARDCPRIRDGQREDCLKVVEFLRGHPWSSLDAISRDSLGGRLKPPEVAELLRTLWGLVLVRCWFDEGDVLYDLSYMR